MTNRHTYLGRVLRPLMGDLVDGLMATPDVLDDVFIVNYLVKQGGGPSFLGRQGLAGFHESLRAFKHGLRDG